MPESEISTLEILFVGLAKAFGGMLTWTWDGRFGTAASEFPAEKKETVLGILEEYLVSRWDSATIAEAPEAAKKVKGHLGGLMSGQLLLLSNPDSEPLAFCAWWPWGNGQTISIRVGLFSGTMDGEQKQALADALKGWFGI